PTKNFQPTASCGQCAATTDEGLEVDHHKLCYLKTWIIFRFAAQSMKQRLGKRSIKARLNRPLMKGGVRDMGRHWGRPKGRGALFRGALSMRCLTHQQHGSHINRPGVMQKRGVRGCLRGNGLATGGRGEFLGRGCGGGRYRAESRPVPTREQLDEQLDDYMSMTKSHLDAQLDAYMAEVD
uniref:Chromatin target of PRMT1 protein C-terminal domain-containing protein n=1 Tax=Pygocentrus nattereri TaxID=42514 RepID=A0AAR2JKW3_PYGNA